MRKQMITQSALGLSLLAGAAVLATAPALAQPYGPPPAPAAYSMGPNETVTVTSTPFRQQSSPLNAPMERTSLSMRVRYTTADLVHPERTRVLRGRIWRAAQRVCNDLAEAYPYHTLSSDEPCMRQAYNNAIVKIDARAVGARIEYNNPAAYGTYPVSYGY